MARYALLDAASVVAAVIEAEAGYTPPPGCTLVSAGPGAAPGGTHANGVFTPPFAPPPVVPGTAILDALSPEQAAKADVRDLVRIGAAADIATVKSKIRRVAAAAGTTPEALRAAASAAS